MAADEGDIDLKYLDEAGFCLWSAVSYGYSKIGQQKCMEQSRKRYGSRISILGLWEVGLGFEYGLAQGGFNSAGRKPRSSSSDDWRCYRIARYIKLMDWIARKAASLLKKTGRLTVVVQDNSPIRQLPGAQGDVACN